MRGFLANRKFLETEMYEDRIRCAALREKITTAAEAAQLVRNGMRVGASGFTRAGDTKAVPL